MRTASSTLRRVYATFDPGGVSTSMVISERSDTGTKPNPPNVPCNQMAPTKEPIAKTAIEKR